MTERTRKDPRAPRNNYALMLESARKIFLECDMERGCRRVGQALTDTEIPVRVLGEIYTLRRADARLFAPSGEEADFETAMSVYDLLGRESSAPHLSGQFVPTMELHGIMGSNSVHEDLGSERAKPFTGKAEALDAACRRLGGIKSGKGDVSYALPVFDCFPVQLRFWEADEEFPAQLQFFFDRLALDYLHYETLWYVSHFVTRRLIAELGAAPAQWIL